MMAFLIVLAVLGYLFLGGMAGYALYLGNVDRCGCQRGKNDYCIDFHSVPAVVVGVLWPLALPVVGGMVATLFLSTRDERAAEKRKRLEAENQRIRKELDEAVKYLERNGIKAGVEGL